MNITQHLINEKRKAKERKVKKIKVDFEVKDHIIHIKKKGFELSI